MRASQYETLRKAVTGDREPRAKIVEAVSDALSVEPSTFIEYSLLTVTRLFDWREVGFDEAVTNLRPREGL